MAWVSRNEMRFDIIVFITSNVVYMLRSNYCVAIPNYCSNFDRISDFEITNYVSNDHNIHQNIPSHGSYSSFENGDDFYLDMNQGFKDNNIQHTIVQAVPINEHVEVTKPVPVPVIKNIGKVLQSITTN